MQSHNERFAKKPYNNLDLHRPFGEYNLETIFCIKEKRTLNNDYTIRYNNRWFQLATKQAVPLRKSTVITVLKAFDGTLRLSLNGHPLAFKEIFKKADTVKEEKKVEYASDKRIYGNKPSKRHPWRSLGSLPRRVDECDFSIELKK